MITTNKTINKLAGLLLLAAVTFAANSNAQDVNPDDYDNIGDAFLAQSQLEAEKQSKASDGKDAEKLKPELKNKAETIEKARESKTKSSTETSAEKPVERTKPLVIDENNLPEYDSLKAYNIFANMSKETVKEDVSRQNKIAPPGDAPYYWKSQPPEDCPLPLSDDYEGLIVTGRGTYEEYGETTFPTWAGDGNLYSTAADGALLLDTRDGPLEDRIPDMENSKGFYAPKKSGDHYYRVKVGGRANHSRSGNYVIIGDDPMHLERKATYIPYCVNSFRLGEHFGTAYPCATLVHDGVWYYAGYGLWSYSNFGNKKTRENYPHAKELLQPVPSHKHGPNVVVPGSVICGVSKFRTSTDYGRTWTPYPNEDGSPQDPGKDTWEMTQLFPETRVIKANSKITSPDQYSGTVKFGTPHFVDFGKNMVHSPDGKAYLVGHGGPADLGKYRPGDQSWIGGDQINLARVSLDANPGAINDLKNWEFFAGRDENGKPVWTSDFKELKPLLEWDDNLGSVTITYNAPLKKHFMWIVAGYPTKWHPRNLILMEADKIDGPWKLVSYMHGFGPAAYFVNAPSKFHSEDGKTMWILYSNNSTVAMPKLPVQSRYGLNVVEVKLRGKSK